MVNVKRRKLATIAAAAALTASVLLGGTFAWTSVSQDAKNQAKGTINPGGRLHDDFNGTNKDIYVENFTATNEETGETGATIYARIRLTEYLQVGDKILDLDDDEENGPTFEKTDTWTLFTLEEEESSMYRKFFEWTWGVGETKTYLPTFNKNKDSLEADINGTYEGIDKDEDAGRPYDDYVGYAEDGTAYEDAAGSDGSVASAQTVNSRYGIEIYDCDDDERDEDKYLNEAIIEAFQAGGGKIVTSFDGTNPIDTETNSTITLEGTDGTEVTAKVINIQKSGEDIEFIELDLPTIEDGSNGETENEPDVRIEAAAAHTVKTTQKTLGVITMQEWKDMGCPQGPYWVYDTDGWAYWADGIEPGEATGCLLTAIEATGKVLDSYHYAIHVTAEFATAGDWGEDKTESTAATGFYINTITEDGIYLLNTIAGGEKDITITGEDSAAPGESIDLTAAVTLGLQTLEDNVTWTIEDPDNPNTGKSNDTEIRLTEVTNAEGEKENVGRLTIGEDETLRSIVVTAYLTSNPDVKTTKRISIDEKLTVTAALADADTENLVVPENIETLALTATVMNQWKEEQTDTVAWRLEEGYTDTQETTAEGTPDETDEDYTYIDTNGVLHVGTEEKAAVIQAVAYVSDGETITESKPFTINLMTQLQYLDRISEDATQWGLADNHIKIDGIHWYVLHRTAEADTDEGEEVLLWAAQGVTGWGGPGSTCDWPYWSADFEFTSDALKRELLGLEEEAEIPDEDDDAWEDSEVIAKANWWKYSNARAWLNSENTTGIQVKETKGYWNGSAWVEDGETDTSGNIGFLADKEILSKNAAKINILTKQEYNDSNTDVTKYETTEDKIFLLTQADIFGHTSNSGNNDDTAVKEYDYTVPNMTSGSLLQDVYADNGTTETNSVNMRMSRKFDNKTGVGTVVSEWSWLRSPRADANRAAGIGNDGTVGYSNYIYSYGRLRPALWLNLP